MLIRPTQTDDFPHIAALTNHFIEHTAVHFGCEPETAESLEAQWLAARDRYPWLTAEIEGRFAGFAKATPWRTRDAYRHTAESAIYMEEHARRTGAGRALYVALLDELRERGFHTVVAGMTLPNPASASFHKALGFTYIGTHPEVGRKFEKWHDVAFYQLHLGTSPDA